MGSVKGAPTSMTSATLLAKAIGTAAVTVHTGTASLKTKEDLRRQVRAGETGSDVCDQRRLNNFGVSKVMQATPPYSKDRRTLFWALQRWKVCLMASIVNDKRLAA